MGLISTTLLKDVLTRGTIAGLTKKVTTENYVQLKRSPAFAHTCPLDISNSDVELLVSLEP